MITMERSSQVSLCLLWVTLILSIHPFVLRAQGEGKPHFARLEAVRLYLSGAELRSSVDVHLTKGSNRVLIANMPESIDEGTVRVSTKDGSISILSTSVLTGYVVPQKWRKSTPRLDELKARKEALTQLITTTGFKVSACKAGLKTLDSNLSMLSRAQNPSPDQLNAQVDLIVRRTEELQLKRDLLNQQIVKTREELALVEQQYAELSGEQTLTSNAVVISIYSPAELNTTLRLTYLSRRAQWEPSYEIRANSVSEPLQFLLRAGVSQSTGVQWENVPITLVYGRPASSNPNLELQPWFIRVHVPQLQRNLLQESRQELRVQSYAVSTASKRGAPEEIIEDSPEVFTDGTAVETVVSQNQLNTTFEVQQGYDIPSDGQQVLIPLGNTTVEATYEYKAIPRISEFAYLQASIAQPESYNLVPASARVVFQNTLVGSTMVNAYSQDGTLNVSLGQDSRISIKSVNVRDHLEDSFLGNNQDRTREYSISIRNNQSAPVQLKLVDQYPLSADERIKVDLLESSDAKVDKEFGSLTWNLSLQAGEKRDVRFSYRVRYSKKIKVEGL